MLWCSAATKRVSVRLWNERTAALNYLDGKILSRTETRHTHVEWLRFLKQLDRETPAELQLHLIVDNYATHKHEGLGKWLKRHPRIARTLLPPELRG